MSPPRDETARLYLRVNAQVAGRKRGETLSDLFTTQLARTPQAVALVDGEERFTYRELDAQIEQVAAALCRLGVGLECRVAVYLQRRASLIAALLGVHRAGGAYVPLDPAYPSERTFAILEDAAPRVVLSEKALLGSLPTLSCPVLTIEEVAAQPAGAYEEASWASGASEALAYLIYTSGSTGKPKGVAIPHRCAVNLIRWAADFFPAEDLQGMLFGTSVNFDLSIWEIFLPLAVGGKIVLAPNVLALPELPAKNEITFINTVPSAMTELLRLGALPSSVRAVALAGEAFRRELAHRIFARQPDLKVYNLYAPSETTTYSTFVRVLPGEDEPTIGAPLDNTRVFVMGPEGNLLPPLEVGELCLGGAGVTRGYLGRPALTAAAFVPDPRGEMPGHSPGDRLYRTGDLVRLRPDGELEFLGRSDHQVKIRGFRVELGEIEKTLEKDTAVLRAAVLARANESGEIELVASFEPEQASADEGAEAPQLIAHLRRELNVKLPSYMVPSRIEMLARLPLLPNGKIDRNTLAARPLPPRDVPPGPDFEAPHAGGEVALAALLGEVLGIADIAAISRHDHFIALGGHSLQASRLAAQWRARHGGGLEAKDLLAGASIAELAAKADQPGPADADVAAVGPLASPPGLEEQEGLPRPLSPAQERLYFLYRLEPGSAFYNESAALQLRGALDARALERALALLDARHAALRTTFGENEKGAPFQLVLPRAEITLARETIEEKQLESRLRGFAAEPFDLAAKRPWRSLLLALAAEEHVLALCVHHLVWDGISLEILEKELAAAYSAYCHGEEPQLAELPYSFADFAAWQRRRLSPEREDAQTEFWRRRLAGNEPLELPLDFARPPVQSHRGSAMRHHLPARLVEALEALGRSHGATPFLTFLAAFLVLLSRLSGQRRVAVGAPFAGRDVAGSETLVGYFVNTLILAGELGHEKQFAGLLAALRRDMASAQEHQDVPLERLIAKLAPQRESSRNPLFQVVFQLFEGDPAPPSLSDLATSRLAAAAPTAKFDLELLLQREKGGGLTIDTTYARDLFLPQTLARWMELYELLLREILAAPQRPLDEIPLLLPTDRALYTAINQGGAGTPRQDSLASLFAAQVAAAPQRIALEFGARQLTFGELDDASNRLAHLLRARGVMPGSMVGLCFERGLELPLAILAVIKAGAAYVPLDTGYPAERLRGMVEDTAIEVLLGSREELARLPNLAAAVLVLEELTGELAKAPVSALPDYGGGLLPALTIFTSGSTGKPKGVVITQEAICRLLIESRFVTIRPGDVLPQISTASFDAYTLELWGALLHGGRLLVIDRDTLLEPRAFAAAIAGREVAVMFLTVALFTQMVLEEPRAFEGVRHLMFGGEACEPGVVRRALENPPQHLQNGYGPAECTTFATTYEALELAEDAVSVPIGKPIPFTEAVVLDHAGQIAPIGVRGELCLGGAGLALGYWRRPALTARSFVPHPVSTQPGARLYRTGDLARLLPSGDFDYLGRIDFQVKVRGYRIELGEVEAVLGRHPAVREKVALTQGQGRDQMLVAFVVVEKGEDGKAQVSPAELQHFAGETLPSFAVPQVHVLEEMPLSPNGKIDRRSLPDLRGLEKPARSLAPGSGNGTRSGTGEHGGPPLRGDAEPGLDALERQVAAAFGEVLGLEDLDLDDDFFALGGHSLLATRLIAKVRQLCGIEVPMRTLFAYPKVGDFAAAAAPLVAARSPAEEGWRPGPESTPGELSFAQQRLFFLHRFDPASPVYNIPAAFRLRGELDKKALLAALTALEARQAILRTRLREEEGIAFPELLPAGELRLEEEIIAAKELPGRLRRLAETGFDLLREKPWRCRLFELGEAEHVLFVNVHHIAFDGLSLVVFEKELAALYRAALHGGNAGLEPLPWTYTDFAAWQRSWLQGEELERQLEFWRPRAGLEPLELPTDKLRPPIPSFRGEVLEHHLDAELVRQIEEIGRRAGATPFLTFLAPFYMLLARLSGQSAVRVGVPFSGRHGGEVENLVGFFINTLVLAAELGDDPSFSTLLPRLREEFAEVYARQDVPFDKLAAELQEVRDASRNPLYQVAFQLFEREHPKLDFGPLEVEAMPVELGVAKLDLDLLLEREESGIRISAWFATDLFEAATVAGWLELYEILLRQILAAPEHPLSRHPLLRPADRALYAAVNDNATAFPREASLASLFAAQVAAGPERIALEHLGQQLTYRQLDERTGHLAHALRERGALPGSMVGLCFERGIDLAIAILAVVKTGAAYAPLDGDYPAARLRGMALDTAMPILLGSATQVARLPDLGVPVFAFEDLEIPQESRASQDFQGSLPELGGLAPAVTIFTSGSTGRPKGVVVTQRAICRLVRDTNYIALGPGDVVAQVSTASFDVYTFEIWGALLNGGRLLIIGRETLLDPRALAETIAGRDIAAMFLTVALFTQMVLEEPQAFTQVRHLMFGGEACEPSVVRRALEYKPAHLQNGYGPAECTTYATTYEVTSLAESAGSVPIGKPVANTEALVIDRFGQVASVGVHGELCLGGDGLALGYWRRPSLTASAFVPHPASVVPGARLYRTGDLARLLPSGDFDYLGRIDFQVKVRGYRIELGEIEAVLGRHPAVREKIALTQGKGADQLLIAFVTVGRGKEGEPLVGAGELQNFIALTLPAFAVPLVHLLGTMPLTPNGKIDRRALPILGSAELSRGKKTPPSTELEKKIAAAFSEVLAAAGLGSSELGLEDDFFALGGHSLLAIRLMAKVREKTGIEVPVRVLFAEATVGALAAAAAAAQSPPISLRPGPAAGAAPELSFAQQRLFFLHRLDPFSPVYNLPAAYKLRGPLSHAALREALAMIEERQEVLRTRFREQDGAGYPEILPSGAFELPCERTTRESLPKRLRELAEQSFDLLAEKSWRAVLLELNEEERVLLINVHHIAFDGLSLLAFENELAALLRAGQEGKKPELPELPSSYAEFAAWQKSWLQGRELEEQLAFWRSRPRPGALELPTDRPRPPMPSYRGDSAERRLDAPLVRQIEAFARENGSTPFLAFLAPFLMLLARLSGQSRVGVGTPFSGRHQGEVENLFGFFVNSLLLSADLGDDPSLASLLPRLREDFAQVYAHQDVPFEKLVEELQVERDPSRNPLFQVMFQLFDRGARQADFGTLEVQAIDSGLRVAKFDLDVALERGEQGEIVASAWYAKDLFHHATVAGWLELYEILLREALANPSRPLSSFTLLRPADRALYAAANSNATGFPREASLAALFAAQAATGSERIAAEYRGRLLTYNELDRQTNQLGHLLRARGVRPGSMVGLCFERGLELAIAILAVVKTGAAYVPLDGDYPEARLRAMAEDTAMPILLGSEKQVTRLPELGIPMLKLEGLAEELAAASPQPLPEVPGGLAPAVVIFTSGSTGKPKGVVITQRAVCRLVLDTNYIRFEPGDVVTQISTASFDVYTFEIWGAFLNGGRLLVIDRETLLEPRVFAEQIAGRDIAAMFLTVTLFTQMMLEEPQAFSQVRHLMFGGEACEPSIVRRALEHKPAHLQNGYGPAECTTYATTCDITFLAEDAGSVPIGKPVANTEVLVLDRAGQPSSVGVHGELCLAGEGLALGYWRRPALTAKAFVPHPCSNEPGARLYRTGDLARLLPTGDFDYLGRIDFQVKVRGYRIELGEIEAVLGRQPAVREKIAMTRGSGVDQLLVAFVTVERSEGGEPAAGAQELQLFCAQTLPSFSVPLIRLLEEMPFTPNGKIDRKALEQVELFAEGSALPAEMPRGELEEQIAEVWRETLGIEQPGRDADFFALGGHSLLASRLISRLRQKIGCELPLRAIFEAPTIAALAEKIESAGRAGSGPFPAQAPSIPYLDRPAGIPAPAPLSAGQEQLFFLQSLDPQSSAFNMPLLWRVAGELAKATFEQACGDVVARHEILRTTFRLEAGKARQIVHAEGAIFFAHIDLAHLGGDAEAKARRLATSEAGHVFDLGRLPLVRFHLFALGEKNSLLLIHLHHLVGDGRSFEILLRDLEGAYLARLQGIAPDWSPLPLHYADFAAWQQSWLDSDLARGQLARQSERLHASAYDFELPSDFPRQAEGSRRGAMLAKTCPAALTGRARSFAPAGGTSLFMTLLAAFEGFYARWSGLQDLYVGTPMVARQVPELEGLIGFFVNTAVVRVPATGDPSFLQLLARTRAATLDAFEATDLPYGRVVERLERSGNGLFSLFFTYAQENAGQTFAGRPLESIELGNGSSQFELTFHLGDHGETLELIAEYDAGLFAQRTIENALDDYLLLLENALTAPQLPLSQLLPQPRRPSVQDPQKVAAEIPRGAETADKKDLSKNQKEKLLARLAKAKARGEPQPQ